MKHESAFPNSNLVEGQQALAGGLTKREYFAGLAMQALTHEYTRHGQSPEVLVEFIAAGAVKIADALCERLAKDEEERTQDIPY